MRLAAYQFAVSGDCEHNYQIIKSALFKAIREKVNLIVFPECAITGYPPRDLANSKSVDAERLKGIETELQSISDETGISVLIGGIACEQGEYFNRAHLFRPMQGKQCYDKRALWGWDMDNFSKGSHNGIFEIDGFRVGVRICYEIRFPEYFRELFREKTDLNIVLFYDVADNNDTDRYQMIKGHIQTRAVENVCDTLSVNATYPFQTAPTILFDKSGRVLAECPRNEEAFLVCNIEKRELDYGEKGRRDISKYLLNL